MRLSKPAVTNGLLLLAALVLALVLWETPRHGKAPHPVPKLTRVKGAAITDVTIKRPGRPSIHLERRGPQWWLLRPFKARADRFRVDALTDIADTLPSDRFAAPGKSLSAFGLAPPRAVLTLNHDAIMIGRRRPFGDLRYVLVKHTIALVPAETIHPRRLTSDSFLSTKLLGGHVHPVAFSLPHLRVTRRHGIWRVTPQPVAVSNDRINAFVDAWRYARALSVSRYHGAPPLGHVIIGYRSAATAQRAASRQQLVIDIIATHPELVLARPDQGLEYHFPQEIGRRLLTIRRRARTP